MADLLALDCPKSDVMFRCSYPMTLTELIEKEGNSYLEHIRAGFLMGQRKVVWVAYEPITAFRRKLHGEEGESDEEVAAKYPDYRDYVAEVRTPGYFIIASDGKGNYLLTDIPF